VDGERAAAPIGNQTSDVAIFGAGPAGLIAAERLAEAGCRVTIYDQMPSPARKLLMAGRGGLNLTHSEPVDALLKRYGNAHPRLIEAIRNFPPDRLVAWANGLGADMFVGSSGRMFPRAMKASPLLRAWLSRLAGLGVRIAPRHRLLDLVPAAKDSRAPLAKVRTPDGASATLSPDAIVLALGGASWPRLGSHGQWTEMLSPLDVPIAPLEPANAALLIRWSPHLVARHAGTPLKRLAIHVGGCRFPGEAVLTRTGLEGSPAYAAAPLVREQLKRSGGHPVTITLDLKHNMELAVLEARLAASPAKQSLANRLRKAAALHPAAIALLREGGGHSELPKETAALARHIKSLPLEVTGIGGIERAISTAGGVMFDALDGRLMLRRLPGVFVAGEMLDWEAPTGGYLLQAAFATGAAAADGALAWLGEVESHIGGPAEPTR